MKKNNYMMQYLFVMVGLIFMSCSKEKMSLLDFSDPFGNSTENTAPTPVLKDSKRPILITDESESKVFIIDSLSNGIMWEWKASEQLNATQAAWFRAMDDAKAVYNNEYVMFTASSGGAALVRISDKKLMFYANVKGSPHSIEVLPDGNIVVACSTNGTADGDALKLYRVDSDNPLVTAETKRYNLTFGHNLVWDKEREVLWATDDQNLYSYSYDYSDPNNPELTKNADFYSLPDVEPHDMFPVYGKDQLYLTTKSGIYIFDITNKTFTKHAYSKENIKSISDGPAGFGTLVMQPTTSYWTTRVTNIRGSSVFFNAGYKMYKARWFIENLFSYPADHAYKQSK